jgi:hypothetical protein
LAIWSSFTWQFGAILLGNLEQFYSSCKVSAFFGTYDIYLWKTCQKDTITKRYKSINCKKFAPFTSRKTALDRHHFPANLLLYTNEARTLVSTNEVPAPAQFSFLVVIRLGHFRRRSLFSTKLKIEQAERKAKWRNSISHVF